MSLRDISSLLTEQPESGGGGPGSTFDIKNRTRSYKFKPIYTDTIFNAMEYGDQGLNENDGYVVSYSIAAAVGYSVLNLTFTTSPGNGGSGGGGGGGQKTLHLPQYYLEQNQDNLPLEQVSGYLTNWNYDLAAKEGTTDIPGFWSTATDTALSSDNGAIYLWVSDSSQVQSGWYILKTKTKPDIEKLNFAAVVREEVWIENEKQAEQYVITKTQIKAPSFLFYISGGEWLAQPSVIAPDGDLWKVTNTYLHADTWDSDFY